MHDFINTQTGWAGIAGDKPGAALAVVASLDVDAGPARAGYQISRYGTFVVEANESEQSGYGCVCIYIYI